MFDAIRKKHALKGATVVCFRAEGCMASDHRFAWVGTVTGFRANRLTTESAVVKVHKRDGCQDSRDLDLGEEYPVVADGSLQQIGPALFFYVV